MAWISPCQSGFSVSLLVSATTSDRSDFRRIAAPNSLLPPPTPLLGPATISCSMTSSRRVIRAGVSMGCPKDRSPVPSGAMGPTIVDAADAHRYEARDDDVLAGFIDYVVKPGRIALVHTEVLPTHGDRASESC